MNYRNILTAISLLVLFACQGNDFRTKAALNELEQDTSLARDLALAGDDTLLYAEAADVAMDEDTVTRVVTRGEPAKAPVRNAPPEPARQPSVDPATKGTAAPRRDAGACSSPAAPDQRRCLMQYLARSDASLNRTYQRLVGQLGPAEEERLRTAQRAWLVYRDTECRRKTRSSEGALWAPVRARCLAEYSAARERELAAKLQ